MDSQSATKPGQGSTLNKAFKCVCVYIYITFVQVLPPTGSQPSSTYCHRKVCKQEELTMGNVRLHLFFDLLWCSDQLLSNLPGIRFSSWNEYTGIVLIQELCSSQGRFSLRS